MSESKQSDHLHRAEHDELLDLISEKDERVREREAEAESTKRIAYGKGLLRRIFSLRTLMIVAVIIVGVFVIRVIELASFRTDETSWVDDLQHGNVKMAFNKLSDATSAAADQLVFSRLSVESLVNDLNRALPHLSKAGYHLTEMEIVLGVPPKLIPHFYHDESVKVNMYEVLNEVGDNRVGKALILALIEAGELQRNIKMGNMTFNHVEVELGPIPSLVVQYKIDDQDVKDIIKQKMKNAQQ